MKNIKLSSIPVGVLLIAGFFVFGAVFLLVLFLINPELAGVAIAERHGLPDSTGSWILPAIAGVDLVIAYGLLTLSCWGFILTIAYLLYFGMVNFYLTAATRAISYCGIVSWSILLISYLIIMRRQFLGAGKVKRS